MKLDIDAFMMHKSSQWLINITLGIFGVVGLGGSLLGMLGLISNEAANLAWDVGIWTAGTVFGTMIILAWLQGILGK